METRTIYEIIGYVGSALVLVSFLMTSVFKLRVVNMCGSLASVVYGVLVHTYPTVVMNAALLVINAFFLWKYFSSKNVYTSKEISPLDGSIKMFLDKYKEDIANFFPHFDKELIKYNTAIIVYCEDTFAGVLIGTVKEGVLDIALDYTTKSYRDFSVGKYLYAEIAKRGIKKCSFTKDIPQSFEYLKNCGFEMVGETMEKEF